MKKLAFAVLVLIMAICSCDNGTSFGIDVSQYNGDIDWSMVKSQTKTKDPIKFVIIRSTVGTSKDTKYQKNYKGAKEQGLVVGSYHYYRPNENSTKQFENFKAVVHLKKGDILPVVDIEALSSVQSFASLKVGLRNFVSLVEKEYGVTPIIYTKLDMWKKISSDFADCKVWIAAYSTHRRDDPIVKNAAIHQFTKEIRNIPGIPSKFVDGDDARNLASIIY
jgi:lysozyme